MAELTSATADGSLSAKLMWYNEYRKDIKGTIAKGGNQMSERTFVINEKPTNKRTIGRLNSDLSPHSDQETVPTQRPIGRINNELHPRSSLETIHNQKLIGRINNELNPKADQGQIPTQKLIGMINNAPIDKTMLN
jgi:hypothetical protein